MFVFVLQGNYKKIPHSFFFAFFVGVFLLTLLNAIPSKSKGSHFLSIKYGNKQAVCSIFHVTRCLCNVYANFRAIIVYSQQACAQ